MRPSQERQPARARRLPRRATDRVEDLTAWALLAAGLFLLLAGALVTMGAYRGVAERTAAAERALHPVEAVLLDGGPVPGGDPGVRSPRSARYRDAAGQEHDVAVPVVGRPPAGTAVRVWLDRDGRAVAAPPDELDAVVLGGAAGLGVVVGGGLVLVVLWMSVRAGLDRRNAEGWAREWEQVEPGWSGRAR